MKHPEMLEVIDEEGNVVGMAPRSKCHGDPSLAHRAVHIFVRNPKGDVFLQKRSMSKDIQPGKWDTSVGGHVDPGENYEQAAQRELLEELGIELETLGGPDALIRKHDYTWRTELETEYIRTFEIVSEGPFHLHADEIDEGRFWSPQELREGCGHGVFSPNLEKELSLLDLV